MAFQPKKVGAIKSSIRLFFVCELLKYGNLSFAQCQVWENLREYERACLMTNLLAD